MPSSRRVVSFCLALSFLLALPAASADPVSTGGALWVPGALVGEAGSRLTPAAVAGGVKTVAASGSYTLILKNDDTLWTTGENTSGQLGVGDALNRSVPVQVAANVAVVFPSELNHSFFLKHDGTLWAFGANPSGSLGNGDPSGNHQRVPVEVATNVKTVAASREHTLFLKNDDTLWGMGRNQYGQLGLDPTTYPQVNEPTQLGTDVTRIAVQDDASFLIKTDGTLWAMGRNEYGRLGTGNTADLSTPTQIATNVADVSLGFLCTYFLKTDGTLWSMGRNVVGELGDGTTGDRWLPVTVASGVSHVYANGSTTAFFLKPDHTLWGMGANNRGQLGDGTNTNRTSPVQIAGNVASVQGKWETTYFLKRDASLWGTGGNNLGQLGDGTTTDRQTPQQIAASVASFSFSTNSSSLLYVTADSELWGVGDGRVGQLGDGVTIPERLLAAPDAIAADVGNNDIWYVRSDGSLWSIVDGKATDAGVGGVIGASTDDYDLVAAYLKNDGSVRRIEMDNTTTVLPVTGVAQIFDGFGYHLFLKSDGSLWGMNTSFTSSTTPVFSDGTNPALVATGVTSVSADNNHFLFVKNDRTLWGQGFITLGWPDGAQSSPTPIQLASDVTSASAQQNADAYLKTDGSLWLVAMGWGAHTTGAQLVATNVANAAAASQTVFYVKNDGTLFRRSYSYYNGLLGGMGVVAENVSQVIAARYTDTYIFIQESGGTLPVIDAQPQSSSAAFGATLQLEVTASGNGPLDYQWYKNGIRLPHGRSAQLYLPYATQADVGNYTVKVTNRGGSVTSDPVVVTLDKTTVGIELSGLSLIYDGMHRHAVAALQGVVTTYSGTAGSPGSLDGTGAAARFNFPQGSAVDNAGNVYVADSNNHVIRKITPAGVVTTLAGTALNTGATDATGGAARFYGPQGVAVDASGNVYVADFGNHAIRKITPAGVVTTLAGSLGVAGSADGVGTAALFDSPADVAVDGAGHVYVADSNNHTIRKITPAGVVTTLAGLADSQGSADGVGGDARFSLPDSVAVNAAGQVYVADFNNSTIRTITPLGEVTTFAGTAGALGSADGAGPAAQFAYPSGVGLDGAGNAYVVDGVGLIRKITPAGVVTTLAGDPNFQTGSADGVGAAARFNGPRGLAVDSAGTIYVADSSNYEIRKITPGGVVTTFAGALSTRGSADGTGGAAQYAIPQGMAMDGAGNLYIADSANATIRKVSPAGVVTTLAGTAGIIGSADGAGSAARFVFPMGVAADGTGNVYVADHYDQTIRKITPAGVVTTLAGTHDIAGSADGTGSDAQFNYPSALAVDGAGNVYVTDTYNYTIRKIDPAGVVTTLVGSPGLPGSIDGVGAAARFGAVQGVTLDNAGNLYVADASNHVIRKITPDGSVTTLAGAYFFGVGGAVDGEGDVARFNQPYGLAVDHAGNVYVADTLNHTLRKVTPDGFVTTVAGAAGLAAPIDGAGSNARFYYPMGVAVDPAGNVYVSDGYGNIIRKVTGVSGTVAVTYNGSSTAPTAPGTYSVIATLDDPRYQGTASGTLVIAKAPQNAPTVWVPESVFYGHSCVVTANTSAGAVEWSLGAGSTATGAAINATTGVVSYTSVGTVKIRARFLGTANFDASAYTEATVTIQRAPLNASVSNNFIYTGSPQGPVVLVTSPNATYTIGGTTSATNVGDYELSITGTGNYDGVGSYSWAIRKTSAAVTWNSLSAIFDGTPKPVTVVTNPAGKAVTLTYDGSSTAPTLPGSYTVVGTVTDPSYEGSASGTFVIFDDGPVVTGHSTTRNVIAPDGELTLSATVAATGTPSYQWFHDGRIMPGQTSASLTLGQATDANNGAYWVAISNTAGSTLSQPFFVTVSPADFRVRAWGNNNHGQATPPVGLNDAVALAGGAEHAVALRRDGTVVAWGRNLEHQTDVPTGLENVVKIATSPGSNHSLALRTDGTVVGWGTNWDQELEVPPSLDKVVAIAVVNGSSFALTVDGKVHGWGYINAPGYISTNPIRIPAGLSNVVAIAGGNQHMLALKSDGTVVAWGDNGYGQVTVPAGLTGVVAIAASGSHSLALKDDGTIVEWGYSPWGVAPADLAGVTKIFAGGYHSLALKDNGGLVAWGGNSFGQSLIPAGVANPATVAAGGGFSMALLDMSSDIGPAILTHPVAQTAVEGSAVTFTAAASGSPAPDFQWQKDGLDIGGATGSSLTLTSVSTADAGSYTVVIGNHLASLTSNPASLVINPKVVFSTMTKARQAVDPGDSASFGVTVSATGTTTYQWTHNGRVIPEATGSSLNIANATRTASGWYTVLATDAYSTQRSRPFFLTVAPANTQVIGWGSNSDGQTNIPADLTDAIAIAAGDRFAVVLRRNGTLVQWGRGRQSDPATASTLTDVTALTANGAGSRAVKSNGTVATWGLTALFGTVPSDLTDTVGVAATSSGISVALRSNGTLVSWGSGSYGEQNFPAGLNDIVAVTAGDEHMLALKSDGTVVAWGRNDAGQATVPAGLEGVVAIAAGTKHSMALKADGTVVPWGSNTKGQNNLPAGLARVVAIADGDASFAVKADGTIAAWGFDLNGETNVPDNLRSVFAIATYGSSAYALRAGMPYSASDLNGDGNADIVLQNLTTGARTLRWMNGTTLISETDLGALAKEWSIATTTDFNDDRQPDLLLQNSQTGERAIRLMNGPVPDADVSLGTVPVEWSIAAAADFNDDSKSDILWQNTTTGERGFWFMDGTTLSSTAIIATVPVEWSIAAAADFNSDSKPDILWQNTTTGQRYIWFMNGSTRIGDADLGIVPLEWSIATAADFNSDGKPDILWQNATTGQCYLWFMNGSTRIGDADLGVLPAGWSLAGVSVQEALAHTSNVDFNGDDKADLLWQNTTTGERGFWFMDGTTPSSTAIIATVPVEWSIAAAADFNGNSKPDIVWQNTATGERGFWFMDGTTTTSTAIIGTVPVEWSVAAAADFNDDGKPDIVWQNTTTGERGFWFMDGSTTSSTAIIGTVPLEWSIAAAADFNGDGKPDLVWQNTTTGERGFWFMDGTTTTNTAIIGTVPVVWSIAAAADFNGDGKPDLVWQNTTTGERGFWLMDGFTTTSTATIGTVPVEWSITK